MAPDPGAGGWLPSRCQASSMKRRNERSRPASRATTVQLYAYMVEYNNETIVRLLAIYHYCLHQPHQ